MAACQVLLAIIGPAWLTATDEQGNRRLDDPDDIVRLEVEAALDRGVRVIPILAEGAVMPGRQNLPESLAGLVRRNALPIRHESFRSDAGRLVTAIERILAPASGTAAAPSLSAAHGVRSAGNVLGAVTQTDSGPARSDADRAARFLTEAERIANSLTNQPSKASALTRIATALAATDPDRAERIASSITNEYWKVWALTGAVEAPAATSSLRQVHSCL